MLQHSTGLSLVLGRLLTTWCDQLQPPSLDRYLELGGFTGLVRSTKMDPTELVAELRASGLRDSGPAAEPVYLDWQRFLRRRKPGRLVVDAVQLDPQNQAGAYLLTHNPYGLVEGLLVAAHLFGVKRAVVLLPPELAPCEAPLLNAVEMIHRLDLHLEHELVVELERGAQPSIWDHGPRWDQEGEAASLVHHLETWYHLALIMALGAERYQGTGSEGHYGTRLVTLGGAVAEPGLTEAPLGGDLWQVVETLGGGPAGERRPLALALDHGMGGYLAVEAAQGLLLAPDELAAAGVCPSPGTLWLLEDGTDLVEDTRRALYRYWRLSGEETSPARRLIARALRLVTEVTKGRGAPHTLDELKRVGEELTAEGLAAAWPLNSSLEHFLPQWEAYLRRPLPRPPAPCQQTCPAHIDIPSFLAQIGHQEHKKATATICKDNPLPYTCGLVCPAPCEGACLRGEKDAPVHIRAMKAVAARHALEEGGYLKPRTAKPSGKRVAIVGSGPAGLACAYYLALRGHQVEIFEAQEKAGGMLRYGIPAYRLPREVLDTELETITRLGVRIHTGREIQRLDQLRGEGFDAYFLALGTQISRLIPIEGVDLPFVLGGLDFLKQVHAGENPRVGPRVVVVGGGNVAIDVALTALRQGAHRVDMFCLEKRREMPASPHEVEQALAEGVAIHNSWGPVSVSPEGEVTFQLCTRVFDERGRFSPQFNPHRRTKIVADHVILAIGQATDLACVEQDSLVKTERGLICADPRTLATDEPGVFAGGDVVHGPQTVVMAIRAGKRAAASIDAYLRGRELDERRLEPTRRAEVPPLGVDAQRRTYLRRARMPYLDVEDREGNYHQVELGLDDEMAHNEASRCLRCDLCIGCGLCQLVCCEVGAEALRLAETSAGRLAFHDFTRPATRCVGCGACGQVCPTGAIQVVDEGHLRRTIITGTVVREHELLPCTSCGRPYITRAYLEHLKHRVGPQTVDHVERGLCPACARRRRAHELTGDLAAALMRPLAWAQR